MNKAQSIRLKCLGCAGSHKEVTLCHLFDCPLWVFRFGYSMKDKRYERRMKTAEVTYKEEFKELKDMDIEPAEFYTITYNKPPSMKKGQKEAVSG